ncbi:MAG TPA: hypothetical protein VGI67_20255 [Thermoleophilaceae bacterium]|jgi:hypothetical protein
MPNRAQSSLISVLFPNRARKRRQLPSASLCPACGEPLAAADHAVLKSGGLYHAGCVLYRPRVSEG